jgi:hypothetical protein
MISFVVSFQTVILADPVPTVQVMSSSSFCYATLLSSRRFPRVVSVCGFAENVTTVRGSALLLSEERKTEGYRKVGSPEKT